MMIQKYTGLLFVLNLLLVNTATAQDTVRTMRENEFLSIVRSYHPVAKQGALLVDMARAELQTIRGVFDPTLYYNNDQKTFDGKNYFNYSNAELAVPTWLGVELYAGAENNFGDFLNSESTAGRTSYAGVSIPVLRDLILDKRRAALQQGKLFVQQSRWEQRNVINDLLLDAYNAYWDWARQYQVFLVLENTVRINELRYELLKVSFEQGDRAAIDTTEALAQLQTFIQMREEALLKFRKASLELSTFLWLPDNRPVYITDRVIPDTLWAKQQFGTVNISNLTDWLTQTTTNHPKLQILELKTQSLEVERRLKFQSILPKADVKYNFLQRGYNVLGGSNYNFFENNYKFGINVAIPIPNRTGFGAYRAAKIKLQSIDLERNFTQLNLENKVRFHYNEVMNLQKQIRIYEDAYRNYVRLFEAEQLKFSLGETTVFLLNTRENKALEALQKLLELKSKFYQAFASLNWASGQLQ
ncbi:MAG TPA: TolC family protein [Lacibacter sp.]|nr:TolC family protein [Lacibacter sp.]